MLYIVVYLDLIFLINFLADILILWMTGKILRIPVHRGRMAGGAAFGAAMLLLPIQFPSLFLDGRGMTVCLGISLLADAIAFGIGKNIWKCWFLSTTITVFLAGSMNGFRSYWGLDTLDFGIWLGLFIAAALCLGIWIGLLRGLTEEGKGVYGIVLRQGSRMAEGTVLLDTGNRLQDGLFGKPVIILGDKLVKQCLTETEYDVVRQYDRDKSLDYNTLIQNRICRKDCFHEITFQSVGKQSGKLLCFLMDEVEIKNTGRILRKQPVAIGPDVLFDGKQYSGLLHGKCI